ncbi:minichromosomal maintenance complex subunit, putative [Bodo saltans]|uniref:Minichromosomal maintenance complex subunit, putative n=1 Tax=Bodo saltans TaxID=75058 RepID=A0A0S4JF20_BODSA|nr:minichromosomal maintenance complex subunit, putative [Bodo saltans]|eukprot:CUG90084.1 minichromosomal maintenance complex subunit, putative [Bodo saltans]
MRGQAQRQTNVVTARTLLSLIRISQANARLRLSDRVTDVDVREAARLLDCSKASLNDKVPGAGGGGGSRMLSATDAGVFTMIKEVAAGRTIVPLSDLRLALAVKGVTEAQLQQCVTTYSTVGVWVQEGNNLEFS